MAVVLVLAGSIPAEAHRPVWATGNKPVDVPNLSTSYAVYRNLAAQDQFHEYRFAAAKGEALHAEVLIPRISALEDYQVWLALVGPGFPEEPPELAGLAVGRGEGALLLPPGERRSFFEPFTLTRYWKMQGLDHTFAQDGSYRLLAWSPECRAGKYVLVTGRDEDFGVADLLRFPGWFVRVHSFFGHGPHLMVLAGAAAAALSLVAARH